MHGLETIKRLSKEASKQVVEQPGPSSAADILASIMEVAVEYNRVVDLDKVYKALEASHPSIREEIQKHLIEALQSTVRVYGGNADVWGGSVDTANQLVRFQRALAAMGRMTIVKTQEVKRERAREKAVEKLEADIGKAEPPDLLSWLRGRREASGRLNADYRERLALREQVTTINFCTESIGVPTP